jgi:hypothetical protein
MPSKSNTPLLTSIPVDEPLSEEIMALEPYVSHTQINRTLNTEDSQSVYTLASANGYNPVVSVVPVDGVNVENGMIGYITIGVDPSAIQALG